MIKNLIARLTIRRPLEGLVASDVSGRPEGMQAKTVTPRATRQVVTPDGGYRGMYRVTVTAPPMQAKTVEPTSSKQYAMPDDGYVGLSSVTVKGAPLQIKTAPITVKSSETGTVAQTIKPDDVYYGLSAVEVEPLVMHGKEATPNAAGQFIEPDEGYHALSVVVVRGDRNLVPENIKAGVTIFGVTGTCKIEPKTETDTGGATA